MVTIYLFKVRSRVTVESSLLRSRPREMSTRRISSGLRISGIVLATTLSMALSFTSANARRDLDVTHYIEFNSDPRLEF